MVVNIPMRESLMMSVTLLMLSVSVISHLIDLLAGKVPSGQPIGKHAYFPAREVLSAVR
jgi:hypothetical protein